MDWKGRGKGQWGFDIVTWGADGYIFYEAKFRKNPMNLKMIEEEV